MNMSIGQGYTLVTPMHVANMIAMVCNSGKIYRPHLLKEIRDGQSNEVIEEIDACRSGEIDVRGVTDDEHPYTIVGEDQDYDPEDAEVETIYGPPEMFEDEPVSSDTDN